ncbi:MAG: hypothetical protein Q9191_004730, partial [Dirinaria sp. TL-2023a]
MSRRGYPSSEVYEERDREYYAPRRGGRTAEYDEVDIRERRRVADREPDFLREDYGRSSNAGPLVLRDDKRPTAESRPPRRGDREVVETDEVFVSRASREPPRDRPRVKPVERGEAQMRSSTVAATAGREREYHERDREEIIYRDRETFSPPPQQVAREREEFVYRPRERTPPQIAREREEFVFRPRPREPSYEREEIIIREGEREKERPREREYRDEEIIVRRGEKERERPRGFEQEEITIRDREREGLRPRARSYERDSLTVRDDRTVRSRSRDYREEDIIIRRGEGDRPWQRSPPRDYREEDITIRRSEREAPPRNKSRERGYRDDELVIRERDRPREKSRGPRDEEDIIIRHDDNDRRHKDEIIIRRNERSPSPEPYVPPPPPPEPEPVRAPPIHQEIITHHRHIDH